MRWCVVKMDPGMAFQPVVPLGLVSIKIVEHYVDFFLRTAGYYLVYEIQKLPSSAVGIVARLHQSCRHLQGSKQGGSAMTLVFMVESPHRLAIRKAQPSLGTLQRMNGRLFINTDNQGIFRRLKIEADDIGRLLSKLRVCAYTSTAPAL